MNNPDFEAYGETMRWVEKPEAFGLRLVGLAHEVAPANYAYLHNAVSHAGWFLDDFQEETVSGVVYQVPGKCGRARYMVGYADPWNDGSACLVMRLIEGEKHNGDGYDPALRDVARAADGIAELMAEDEREYRAAWEAGRDAREKAREAMDACRRWKQAVKASFAVFRNRRNIKSVDVKLLFKAQSKDARDYWEEYQDARADFHDALDPGHYDVATWRDGYENY